MKRLFLFALILSMIAVMLTGCGAKETNEAAAVNPETAEITIHKIGIPTYNIKDAQVRMFKDYLDNYIKGCFEDVEFIYSDSLTNADEMMNFLQLCTDNGCEAIMSFNTYDLQKEVEFCASKEMYYIRPSSNSTDADFNAAAENPWFLGEIGPGMQLETEACVNMVQTMASKGDNQNFIILSGGAFMGIEMHRVRTIAMLNTLAEVYGTAFDRSAEELAVVSEPTEVTAGEISVLICPGFIELPQYGAAASEAIMTGKYTSILSTIAVTPLMDALSTVDIRCGATDCFSEDNFFGFKKGKISYIAGKYESEIAPAFAAVYNAITGNSDLYRPEGKAFRLEQGYWTAIDNASYDSMYALSSGISINAYSSEDIYSVIKVYNEEADFDGFRKLVESYTYEDALARRAM